MWLRLLVVAVALLPCSTAIAIKTPTIASKAPTLQTRPPARPELSVVRDADEPRGAHGSLSRRSCLNRSIGSVVAAALGGVHPTDATALVASNSEPAGLFHTAWPVPHERFGPTSSLLLAERTSASSDALVLLPPTVVLPSGVSYVELRPGTGDAVVAPNRLVGMELTARCKAFPTAKDPMGVRYFATAQDTEFNEWAVTMSVGQLMPQLEEGLMGMKRSAVRRIEVPSSAVYAAKRLNQLPLPTTKEGKKRYDALFQYGLADATLIFEVLVTRIK